MSVTDTALDVARRTLAARDRRRVVRRRSLGPVYIADYPPAPADWVGRTATDARGRRWRRGPHGWWVRETGQLGGDRIATWASLGSIHGPIELDR